MRGKAALRRAGIALLLLLVGVLGVPSTASAHAVLLATTPTDGASLTGPPTEITLEFDEDVDVAAAVIRVFDGEGRSVTVGTPTAHDDPGAATTSLLGVTLPRLPNDRYLVRWQSITSDDYHPVNGSFAFGVGVAVEPQGQSDARGLGSPLESLTRTLSVLGFMLVTGACAVLVVLRRQLKQRPGSYRILERVAEVGVITALLGLLALEGLLTISAGSPPSWSFLAYWAATAVGLVVATLTSRAPIAPGRAPATTSLLVAGTGVLVAAWGLGHLGHGSSSAGSLVSTLHVAATGCWAGGLAALLAVAVPALRAGDEAWVRSLVRGFGVLAVPAVVVTTVTGFLLARGIVLSWGGLVDTGYGRGLASKMALVALAVVLGGVTALLARRGPDGPISRSRLMAELGAMALVVVLAASLAGGQPPSDARWLPSPEAAPTSGTLTSEVEDLVVTFNLSPGVPGPNFATVRVLDTRRPSPAPIDAVLVDLGDGRQTPAVRQSPTDWLVSSSEVTASGPRTVTVTARRSGYDDITAAFAWQVAPVPGAERGGAPLLGWWNLLVGCTLVVAALLGAALLRRRRRRAIQTHAGREADEPALV